MATVELRPGDSLNIVWKSVQDTPIGKQEVESNFVFSYDELMQRLQGNTNGHRSKKSGTEGARFSRVVALACNALKKGKWSTGADIDRTEVFERMKLRFEKLNTEEYRNITKNARIALNEIKEKRLLKEGSEQNELANIIKKIETGS